MSEQKEVKIKGKLILKDLVEIYELDSKMEEYKIDLTEYTKSIELLREILKNNISIFQNLLEAIDECILEDGILDVSDIPHLVLCLAKIYKQDIINILKNIKVVDFLNFVEFLITSLEKINYILILENKKCLKTLRASLQLLEIVVPENKEMFGCCF